jgi:hypothetical protein
MWSLDLKWPRICSNYMKVWMYILDKDKGCDERHTLLLVFIATAVRTSVPTRYLVSVF